MLQSPPDGVMLVARLTPTGAKGSVHVMQLSKALLQLAWDGLEVDNTVSHSIRHFCH